MNETQAEYILENYMFAGYNITDLYLSLKSNKDYFNIKKFGIGISAETATQKVYYLNNNQVITVNKKDTQKYQETELYIIQLIRDFNTAFNLINKEIFKNTL